MANDFDEAWQSKKVDDLKKQEEEDLVSVLAQAKYNIPYINLANVPIENEALRLVDEKDARATSVAPFKLTGKNIALAVHSPSQPGVQEIKREIEDKGYIVDVYMVSQASLEKAWSRYQELSHAEQTRAGGLDISGEVIASLGGQIKTLADIPTIVNELSSSNSIHKISRTLEVILAGAISTKASDIHIEPEETNVRLRFRLDGVLQSIMFIPNETYKLLNSRIKLLSGLKLTAKSIAQDGRFSMFVGTEEINIRTSVIPGAYGESIVLRILDPKTIQVKLEELGIPDNLFKIIDVEIKKPNGLILLTGPTGSGKTTSLYAFLRRIYSPEIKIITIEDPIEYHLDGITQTQVEKNYTFSEGLRASLRQDPDVIMVGEIRDAETAKTAVESALTGHLVFSTLHTNSASGVIPRLIDLEVNPKIMGSALHLSIAQRLVRKLCPVCKKQKTPTEEEATLIKKILMNAQTEAKNIQAYGVTPDMPLVLWGAAGCTECNNTGYKGRIGIFEAILTDEAVEKIMQTNPSEREIRKVSEHQGILDMKEDGIIKALKGVTSFDEVSSVVDLHED